MPDSNNAFQNNGFQKSTLAFQGLFYKLMAREGKMTVSYGKAVIYPRPMSRTGTHAYTFTKAVTHRPVVTRVGSLLAVMVHMTVFARTISRLKATAFQINAFKASAFQFIFFQDSMTKSLIPGRTNSRTGHMTVTINRVGVFLRSLTRAGHMIMSFRVPILPRWTGGGSAFSTENPAGASASVDPTPEGAVAYSQEVPEGASGKLEQP